MEVVLRSLEKLCCQLFFFWAHRTFHFELCGLDFFPVQALLAVTSISPIVVVQHTELHLTVG